LLNVLVLDLQPFISECMIWKWYFCSQNNTSLRLHYVNCKILINVKLIFLG